MDKISVVIPVYKVEPYLRQCLDSVVGQTYRNLEIIVVDDGSPDNCGAICDEYAQKDARFRVLHKSNEGVSAARNDGIALATGTWITFADSDDWLEADYYASFMQELAGSEVDILCAAGAVYEYGDHQKIMHSIPEPGMFSGRAEMDMMMARTLACKYDMKGSKRGRLFGSPWDKLYRTSMLREHSMSFDTDLHPAEDVLFNYCAFDYARAAQGCTVTGYHYRRTVSSSATRRFNPNAPKMQYSFFEKLHVHMKGRKLNSVLADALDATVIGSFSWLLRCYYFHPDKKIRYRQVSREIQMFKHEKYVRESIANWQNPWLTLNQTVLLLLLRLPWVWPLKIATAIRSSKRLWR